MKDVCVGREYSRKREIWIGEEEKELGEEREGDVCKREVCEKRDYPRKR